jgi:hypothetical protein
VDEHGRAAAQKSWLVGESKGGKNEFGEGGIGAQAVERGDDRAGDPSPYPEP